MLSLSYWEYKHWFTNIDFTIVGSGIVGLSTALHLKNKYPKAKILVLEKGILPQGASTKNAGFACFGSLSEILADLENHTEEEVFQLVKKRIDGLHLLRKTLGDKNIDYKAYGGFEIFPNHETLVFENCKNKIHTINQFLQPLVKQDIYSLTKNKHPFANVNNQMIKNTLEGQIDTGKMMLSLLQKVQKAGVIILNQTEVMSFSEDENIKIETNFNTFSSGKLIITTNGFAKQLLPKLEVTPARAQVLITEPIKGLKIKGSFHINQGYDYFRNIDNRILLGGGRNLDFATETTTKLETTTIIQNHLHNLLKNVILPNTPFKIAQQWSGIMGVGLQKKPIVQQLTNHTYCGVRMGGMGVAIGSIIGKELVEIIDKNAHQKNQAHT
jgi:gamma-glutamylputrescine oxidase